MELDDDCLIIANEGGWLKSASRSQVGNLLDPTACCSLAIYRSAKGRPRHDASDGWMTPEDLLQRAGELINGAG
jgi:hypothetical protein